MPSYPLEPSSSIRTSLGVDESWIAPHAGVQPRATIARGHMADVGTRPSGVHHDAGRGRRLQRLVRPALATSIAAPAPTSAATRPGPALDHVQKRGKNAET